MSLKHSMQIGYHCAHLHVYVNWLPLWNWEKLPVTWKFSKFLVALARVAVCHQSLWETLLMTQSGSTDSDSASQCWIQLISQTPLIMLRMTKSVFLQRQTAALMFRCGTSREDFSYCLAQSNHNSMSLICCFHNNTLDTKYNTQCKLLESTLQSLY